MTIRMTKEDNRPSARSRCPEAFLMVLGLAHSTLEVQKLHVVSVPEVILSIRMTHIRFNRGRAINQKISWFMFSEKHGPQADFDIRYQLYQVIFSMWVNYREDSYWGVCESLKTEPKKLDNGNG